MKKEKVRNFVAKNSHKFNRPKIEEDRTKYRRKEKHKNHQDD